MVNKDVMKAALQSIGADGDLAEPLAKRLGLLADIRARVVALGNERMAAVKDHAERLKNIEAELNRVRDKCPHPVTRYHADPAGGSDSWTECEVCGDSVARAAERRS